MASYCLLFVVLHLLRASECQMNFTSMYQGEAVAGLLGSSVNFTWSFSGNVGKISWGLIKPADGSSLDVILVNIGQFGLVTVSSSPESTDYSSRVSGIRSGDSSSGQVIFTLSNIKKTDKKLYGCQINPVVPVAATVVDEVNLIVEELPNITLPDFAHASFNERVPVDIPCEASGTPEPDMRWIHNGRVKSLGFRTAQLTFSSISRADAGMYVCRANNSVGTKDKRLTLVVNYKPEGTTLKTSAAQNTTIQGENVTLTCTVKAAIPPVTEYRFYLNDSNNAINSGTNVSPYTIYGVQRARDYGKYKCVAYNNVGDGHSNEVVLNIKVPAKIETLTGNLTVDEGNAIDLRCDVRGYPTPTVTWQKDESPLQSAESGVIHIDRSTRQHAGTYMCTANNNVAPADQKKTFVTVNYAAAITSISASVSKSWLGQIIRLTCVADGVPTPTLSWYTPGGTRLNSVSAEKNTVDVTMNSDQDFGLYNCTALNGFVPASQTVRVQQIKAPGSPSIATINADIQATSLIVRWKPPTDDGGSGITAYRVVILQGSTEKTNKNITDPTARSIEIGNLEKDTNYMVKVFARNFVFEGEAGQRKIKTKFEEAPAVVDFTAVLKDDAVVLKWEEPENNGGVIKKYTIYQRTANDEKWEHFQDLTDISKRESYVKVQKGKTYEFVVTATNEYGESPKTNSRKVDVVGEESLATESRDGVNTAVIAGAGAAGLVLILFLVLFVVWWKRRKNSEDGGSSADDLRGRNPDDFDDGYSAVGAASAARQLQTADVTYAEVDKSGKTNRQQVTDMYAEVDKSKKKPKKKPKKQPGELDYAELDDLRPNFRPAPQPSGGAARPLVRPPAYQGTLYADIAQFGVPQPEPTYDNMPKKDVVYSNVESM